MNAAPTAQLRLLDVQALDTTLGQLAHRRSSLPELADIERLSARVGELRDAIVAAETEDSDIGREQTKIENDVDQVRARAGRDQQRLDAGQVGSPRELENLQSEIASLGRRQAELEDQVLEIMERREEVQQRLARLAAEREQVTAELSAAEARRDGAYAEIDAEAARATQERAALARELPEDLVTLYDKIRASSAGVGAAALHRGRCEGCHLTLPPSELNDLRAAAEDAVLRCEECRRILVRTPESGL